MSRVLMLTGFAPGLIYFRQPLLRAMVAAGHEVIAAAPSEDDRVPPMLSDLGATWRPIEFDRNRVRPIRDLRFLRETRSLVRETKPDRLLTATLKPNIYGGWAAKSERVPSAAMVTGIGTVFMRPGWRRAVAASMLRRACRHHDVIFIQNPEDRSDLVSMGVVRDTSKLVMTAGEGIDLQQWKPRPLPPEPVFLMLSRMLVSKGVREYIEAARLLRDRGVHARVLLAGPEDPGSDAVPLDEVRAAHDRGLLEYLGFVEDVPALLASASVCVLPSWHEGTPHAILEAMAMGRPAITTDVRGCRETVRAGETGVLVPVRQPVALADAMQHMAEDSAGRARMGVAARAFAERAFDADDVAATMIESLGL